MVAVVVAAIMDAFDILTTGGVLLLLSLVIVAAVVVVVAIDCGRCADLTELSALLVFPIFNETEGAIMDVYRKSSRCY